MDAKLYLLVRMRAILLDTSSFSTKLIPARNAETINNKNTVVTLL